jgi:hypothetical protein
VVERSEVVSLPIARHYKRVSNQVLFRNFACIEERVGTSAYQDPFGLGNDLGLHAIEGACGDRKAHIQFS